MRACETGGHWRIPLGVGSRNKAAKHDWVKHDAIKAMRALQVVGKLSFLVLVMAATNSGCINIWKRFTGVALRDWGQKHALWRQGIGGLRWIYRSTILRRELGSDEVFDRLERKYQSLAPHAGQAGSIKGGWQAGCSGRVLKEE